jgi:hypothetical protein
LVFVFAPALAGAPDANSARAFVQTLYSHYPQPSNGPFFDPTGKNAVAVFDPGMVALFKEDQKLAKGEVGFVDADPLCQCQDDGGLKVKILSVNLKSAQAATAVVDLHFEGGQPNPLTLHLVVVNGQWRIYDLSAKDMASYRADFIKANKEHAAGHW